MTTIESALDRIKKLLAHSESARGLGSARDSGSYDAGKRAGLNANTNSGIGGGTTSRASSMRLTA